MPDDVSYHYIHEFTNKNTFNCMMSYKSKEKNYLGLKIEYLAPKNCIVRYQGQWAFKYTELGDSDAGFILFYMTIVVLFILAYASYRAASKTAIDYYRILALYIVGTNIFIITTELIEPLGFNRFLGVGVLMHNLGEWYWLNHLWFGHMLYTTFTFYLILALYVFFVLYITVLLPVEWFFLLASIQGATMDLFLMMTYPFITYKLRQRGKPKLFQGYLIGGIAATFHVFAIIPLFCGFWIVNYALTAITGMTTVPTFFIYILFVIKVLRRFILFKPQNYLTRQATLNDMTVLGHQTIPFYQQETPELRPMQHQSAPPHSPTPQTIQLASKATGTNLSNITRRNGTKLNKSSSNNTDVEMSPDNMTPRPNNMTPRPGPKFIKDLNSNEVYKSKDPDNHENDRKAYSSPQVVYTSPHKLKQREQSLPPDIMIQHPISEQFGDYEKQTHLNHVGILVYFYDFRKGQDRITHCRKFAHFWILLGISFVLAVVINVAFAFAPCYSNGRCFA